MNRSRYHHEILRGTSYGKNSEEFENGYIPIHCGAAGGDLTFLTFNITGKRFMPSS